jgi:AcrR family transcriptional regulator
MLEEAAAELFLEQGYDRTTIDQIAARAGVARTTFFNYFETKGDLLWAELDAAIPRLRDALAATAEPDTFAAVAGALQVTAAATPAARVPWAVTHRELMGTGPELASSGLSRFLRVTDELAKYVERREPGLPPSLVRACASSVAGAVMAAAGAWIAEGTSRRSLAEHIDSAVLPVLDGWRNAAGRHAAA